MAQDAKTAATGDGSPRCAKCGGGTVAGHLVWNGPIRFKAEGSSQFSRGTPVRAQACTACGHIELALEQ